MQQSRHNEADILKAIKTDRQENQIQGERRKTATLEGN